ncbi:MAG: hypothetical protein HRU40_06420 [Saprospiraceae bacterium]|nr:hypothetical protein [Saprospiraceae bacterium]
MNPTPCIHIPELGDACWSGWSDIGKALRVHAHQLPKARIVIVVECYPGTYAGLDMAALKSTLMPNVTCRAEDLYWEEDQIRRTLGSAFSRNPSPLPSLPKHIESYFDPQKKEEIRKTIDTLTDGIILIHGVGAYEVFPSDILIYSDISRWELIQRMRRQELSNMGVDNSNDPFGHKYAWSYFLDWPIATQIKRDLLPKCDFYLETNNWQRPKLVKGNALRKGLALATHTPLYIAPFFDPELWNESSELPGEQYMPPQDHVDLERDNFILILGRQLVEVPAINIGLSHPESFFGEKNKSYNPNLTLRFHRHNRLLNTFHEWSFYPIPEQLNNLFPNDYTPENEDHYIVLETSSNGTMQAGFTNQITTKQKAFFLSKTFSEQEGTKSILDNLLPQPYDHYVIPAGVLHSTGIGTDILQISTGPQIWRQWFRKKERTGMEKQFSELNILTQQRKKSQILGFALKNHFTDTGLISVRLLSLNHGEQELINLGNPGFVYLVSGKGVLIDPGNKNRVGLLHHVLLFIPGSFSGTIHNPNSESCKVIIIRTHFE